MRRLIATLALCGLVGLTTGCAVDIGTACTQVRGQAQTCTAGQP